MAKIPIYTASEELTVTERGPAALAAAARSAEQMGAARAAAMHAAGASIARGLGDVGQALEYQEKKRQEHEELMELTAVNKQFVDLQAEATLNYNKYMAEQKPEDPDYRNAPTKWLQEDYQSRLDNIRRNIRNPKVLRHFESMAMQGYKSMSTHIQQDMLQRDATYLKNFITDMDAKTATSILAPGVEIGGMPAYWNSEFVASKLQERELLLASQIGAMAQYGTLTPDKVREITELALNGRTQILQEVLLRRVRDNPDQAAKDYRENPLFKDIFGPRAVGGGDVTLRKFNEAIERERQHKFTMEKAIAKAQQDAFDDIQQKRIAELSARFDQLTLEGKRATPDMLEEAMQIRYQEGRSGKHDNLAKTLYDNIRNNLLGVSTPESVLTVQAEQELALRILTGQATEFEIAAAATAAAGDKRITEQGRVRLNHLLKGYKDLSEDEDFKAAKRMASAFFGVDVSGFQKVEPIAGINYAKFMMEFVPKFRAAKALGTLKPDDLDPRIPTSLAGKIAAGMNLPTNMQERMQQYNQKTGVTQPPKQAPMPPVPDWLKGYPNAGWSPSRNDWFDTKTGKRLTPDMFRPGPPSP